MGTRADFYVGRDRDAEWIGSIAWDGYRDGIDHAVLQATTESEYRAAVEAFFTGRNDVTRPADGWPWPWKDSGTTDCSYWFFGGQVFDEYSGNYTPATEALPEDDEPPALWGRIEFPDMSERRNMAPAGSTRSGVMLFVGR